MAEVKVLTQFSEFPGPRYCKQGSYSGEAFYHKVLNEAFADALEKAQNKIEGAGEELGKLVGTRTRQMIKKLDSVTALTEKETKKILDESGEDDNELS